MNRSVPLLALLSLFAAAAGHAQTRELSSTGELLDRVAAVVNDGVILKSELDEQVKVISEQLRAKRTELPPPSVLRQQILERLVIQEVQLQRAERMGMKVSDEMLNNQLKLFAARNHVTLDELPVKLQEQGIAYADFRDTIRKEMITTGLQQEVLSHVVVTAREIDQYLAHKSSSLENEDFDVSNILLSMPEAATPEKAAEVEARAREIYERAAKGEDFAQLAVTYSNAQNALEGGSMGWRKGPQLPGFIADLVAKMKPGEIAQPVRTPSGFHIIKLNDRRGVENQVMADQVHARHILVKTSALQDDEAVKAKLEAIRQRILKGEDFATLAQNTSEDPGSSAKGGDLGWMDEKGSFDPAFEKALATLADNEISEPFKSYYGWHIAQVLGRRVQDVTEEKRREQAFAALRESKADEEMELWLRRLRDEAYIEYKL